MRLSTGSEGAQVQSEHDLDFLLHMSGRPTVHSRKIFQQNPFIILTKVLWLTTISWSLVRQWRKNKGM